MEERAVGFPSRESKHRLQFIVGSLSVGAFLLMWAVSIAPVIPMMIRDRGERPEFPPRLFVLSFIVMNVLQFTLPGILGGVLASPMRRHRVSTFAPGMIFAPLWRRGLAKAIDAAIIFGPSFVGQVVTILSLPETGRMRELPREGMIASIIGAIWALPWLVFYVRSEARTGRTIGKALMGIKVLNEELHPCGTGPALVRNLLGMIDAMPCGLVGICSAALTLRWQRVGDLAARTVVIQDAPTTAGNDAAAAGRKHRLPVASVAIFVAILLVGGLAGAYSWVHAIRLPPPPPGAPCPGCGGLVARVRYGASGVQPTLPPKKFLNGSTYGGWKQGGITMLDGGPVAGRLDPGWICENCGKTWLLPLAEYYGRAEIPIRLELAIHWLWKRFH